MFGVFIFFSGIKARAMYANISAAKTVRATGGLDREVWIVTVLLIRSVASR